MQKQQQTAILHQTVVLHGTLQQQQQTLVLRFTLHQTVALHVILQQ